MWALYRLPFARREKQLTNQRNNLLENIDYIDCSDYFITGVRASEMSHTDGPLSIRIGPGVSEGPNKIFSKS